MTDNTGSALLTWPELAAQEAKKTDATLAAMGAAAPDQMAAHSRGTLMAAEFAGLEETVARGIALCGPVVCQPAIVAVTPFLSRAAGSWIGS